MIFVRPSLSSNGERRGLIALTALLLLIPFSPLNKDGKGNGNSPPPPPSQKPLSRTQKRGNSSPASVSPPHKICGRKFPTGGAIRGFLYSSGESGNTLEVFASNYLPYPENTCLPAVQPRNNDCVEGTGDESMFCFGAIP